MLDVVELWVPSDPSKPKLAQLDIYYDHRQSACLRADASMPEPESARVEAIRAKGVSVRFFQLEDGAQGDDLVKELDR